MGEPDKNIFNIKIIDSGREVEMVTTFEGKDYRAAFLKRAYTVFGYETYEQAIGGFVTRTLEHIQEEIRKEYEKI